MYHVLIQCCFSGLIAECYPDDTPLPPADGVMLLDANWGNAAMQLFSLDPAVVSEDDGMHLDPAYNLFEEANGFKKEGSSFSSEFIQRFQKKQGQRNNRILAYALDRWEKIKKGEGHYSDDEPLVIPGANQVFFNNKLYAQDIRLMSHTREPRELIHPDGSSTVEIVRSVRGPENPVSMTHSRSAVPLPDNLCRADDGRLRLWRGFRVGR